MAVVFCLEDDADLIRTSTHGMMTRDDVRFFRDRMDSALRVAGDTASDYLRSARDRLEGFNLNRLRDRVEAMRERFTKRWDDDRISLLGDVADFQDAKPTSRRYLMAGLRIRKLFQQGRCDGYGDLYHDDEPGAIGRTHTPYREMMNGSYVEEVEDEDRFVNYLGVEDEDGEQVLIHRNRVIARENVKTMEEILNRGKQDPTSPKRKTL